MYEAPKSELLEQIDVAYKYKSAKWMNYALIIFLSAMTVYNVLLFPTNDMEVVRRVFLAIVIHIFLIPNVLSIKAFPPSNKGRKKTLIILGIWSALIVIGGVQQQDVYVALLCTVLFLVSIINMVFIYIAGRDLANA